jgi:hypothetical protein
MSDHISLSIEDDDKFSDRLEIELNQLIQSDSPLTMSASNSECDDDDHDHHDDNDDVSVRMKYKKLSFQEIEESVNRYYNTDKSIGEMDTLIAHIKCQKMLYIEAKNYTQKHLNCLIIPSILIATLITVLTPFISTVPNGSYMITAMNAITTLLLSLINHLKLETNTKNYEQIAIRYDKIQSSLELFSTKIIFSSNGTDYKSILYEKLNDVEGKLLEIKEQNDMLLPEEVKRVFPIISNINIFSTINSIEMHRKTCIENLRDVKNEIRLINAKWKKPITNATRKKEEARLRFLCETKNSVKKELMQHFNAFSYINDIFETELEKKPHLDKKWFWQTAPPPMAINSKLIKFI